jgi:hypothetical protein
MQIKLAGYTKIFQTNASEVERENNSNQEKATFLKYFLKAICSICQLNKLICPPYIMEKGEICLSQVYSLTNTLA